MRQSTASNLAIALALLAWPLCYYGFLSQLADFSHDTPRDVVTAYRLKSFAALVAGLSCFCASIWLSGLGFTGAKVRSIIATVFCAGLLALAIVAMRP